MFARNNFPQPNIKHALCEEHASSNIWSMNLCEEHSSSTHIKHVFFVFFLREVYLLTTEYKAWLVSSWETLLLNNTYKALFWWTYSIKHTDHYICLRGTDFIKQYKALVCAGNYFLKRYKALFCTMNIFLKQHIQHMICVRAILPQQNIKHKFCFRGTHFPQTI